MEGGYLIVSALIRYHPISHKSAHQSPPPLSLIYKTPTFRPNAASLHGSAQPSATSFNRFNHLSGVLSSTFIGLSFQQNRVWNIHVSGLEVPGPSWMEMNYMTLLLGTDCRYRGGCVESGWVKGVHLDEVEVSKREGCESGFLFSEEVRSGYGSEAVCSYEERAVC